MPARYDGTRRPDRRVTNDELLWRLERVEDTLKFLSRTMTASLITFGFMVAGGILVYFLTH